MKWLFLLLVVVNLAFFSWQYRQERLRMETPQPGAATVEEVPRLQLLSEHEQSGAELVALGERPAAGSPEPDTPGPSAPRAEFVEPACYRLGPFEASEAAGRAGAELSASGSLPRVREVKRHHRLGYWVFLPPFPDRRQARRAVQGLKERGIKDYLIVSNGSLKNAISLGLFKTREAAEQRQAELRSFGYAPQVDEQTREDRQYWLEFATTESPAVENDRLESLRTRYPGVGLEARDCR